MIGLANLLATGAGTAVARDSWYPVPVNVREPPFNADRARRAEDYRPLEAARDKWRVCVLIRHLKDAFRLAATPDYAPLVPACASRLAAPPVAGSAALLVSGG